MGGIVTGGLPGELAEGAATAAVTVTSAGFDSSWAAGLSAGPWTP